MEHDLAGTDIRYLSDHLLVPFPVRRLRPVELVYVNARWFRHHGRDLSDPAVAAKVERWLEERFGVSVPDANLPEDAFVGPDITIHADRYGATAGSTQGGSGRVGIAGGFNVKGVGRTPLVSQVADWQHSHGHLWLEEAIREAIYAEVFAAEFPHGAVPVIAILATGIRIRHEDTGEVGERALLVRPNFLRFASLQRTVFFGDSGHPGADQVADALRVADLWRSLWVSGSRAIKDGLVCVTLEESFRRLGEQYGFGHAVRLWPGPIFSSNVTLDGRLVDFGSARALPDWTRAQSKLRDHAFGAEEGHVERLARSLAIGARKHGRDERAPTLLDAYRHGRRAGFSRALATHGIAPGSTAAVELSALFDRQQQQRSTLWEEGASKWPFAADHLHASLLTPRPNLYREALQARIRSLLAGKPAPVKGRRRQLTAVIEQEVALALRAAPVAS